MRLATVVRGRRNELETREEDDSDMRLFFLMASTPLLVLRRLGSPEFILRLVVRCRDAASIMVKEPSALKSGIVCCDIRVERPEEL